VGGWKGLDAERSGATHERGGAIQGRRDKRQRSRSGMARRPWAQPRKPRLCGGGRSAAPCVAGKEDSQSGASRLDKNTSLM